MARRVRGSILTAVAALAAAATLLPGGGPAAAGPATRHPALPSTRPFGPDAAVAPDVRVRLGGDLLAAHRTSAAARQAVHPDYPQVTATLRVTLPTDPAPQQVIATIVNTDDARRYAQTLEIAHGRQRLSLPRGHYSVLVLGGTRERAQHLNVARVAFAVDQDVRSSGQVISVDLSAADQNGFPTYSQPAGGTVANESEFYAVEDSAGRDPAGAWEIFGGPHARLLVAGTGGGAHGRLVSVDETTERSAAPAKSPYFLSWAHPDAVVGNEQVEVAPGELTRIDRHYYGDPTIDAGIDARTAVYPFFDPGEETFISAHVPGRRTEYVFSAPHAVWLDDVEVQTDEGGGAAMTGFVHYVPGAAVREDVWRGPLAPGVTVQPRGAQVYPEGVQRTCFVCRTKTGLVAGLMPFVGSDPSLGGLLYAAPGYPPTETQLFVYRDGTQVADLKNSEAGVENGDPIQLGLPAGEHAYRIRETANRAVDGMARSTTAVTDYRFSSSAGSGAPLGPGWRCAAPGAGPCTVLPLLSVRVPLATSLDGTLPDGYAFVIVDVGHVQGAAASPITKFSLSIENGSAAPWTPQTVEDLGNGRYYVAVHNTAAPGTPVSVRWHASDAAGSSITQHADAAYTIAGS